MVAKIFLVLIGLLLINFATSEQESSVEVSRTGHVDTRASENTIEPVNAEARTADVDANEEDTEVKERNARRSLFSTAETSLEDAVYDRKASEKSESKQANAPENEGKEGKTVSEIVTDPGRVGAIKIIIERVATPDLAGEADSSRLHEKAEEVTPDRDGREKSGQERSSKEEAKGRKADDSSENSDATVSRQDTSPSDGSRPVDNQFLSRRYNQMVMPYYYPALNNGLLNNPRLQNPTPNPYAYMMRSSNQFLESNSRSEGSFEQSRTPLETPTRDMENTNAYPYEPIARTPSEPIYQPKNLGQNPTRPPVRNSMIKESFYPENFFASRYYPGPSNNYNPYGFNTNFG